uniref:Transmembrane protein n=1 Tax=Medicago truncatula TaxID=3880 RepID=I3T318_MEDTR|nr:unknown [Medicago truncatula]
MFRTGGGAVFLMFFLFFFLANINFFSDRTMLKFTVGKIKQVVDRKIFSDNNVVCIQTQNLFANCLLENRFCPQTWFQRFRYNNFHFFFSLIKK